MKKRLLILTTLVMTILLSGCNNIKESKQELVEIINQKNQEIEQIKSENEEVKRLMQEFNGETTGYATANYYLDGNIESYNPIKSNIKIDSKLSLPETNNASNTSKVMLSDLFSIVASGNWFINQNGTETNFIHNTGISGYTKVIEIGKDAIYKDTYNEYIAKYLVNIGAKESTSHSIFLDKNKGGCYVDGTIFVSNGENKEEYIMRTGIVGLGSNAIQFQFLFKKGTPADELVMNLLSTIKYSNQQIRIE